MNERGHRSIAALAVLACFLTACPSGPIPRPAPITPTVVGVVANRPVTNVVRFLNGQTVTLAPNAKLLGTGGRAGIDKGDLLLLPSADQSPWFVAIPKGDRGFEYSAPAQDDGDFILFDSGLRLPKYDPFDPGGNPSGRYEGFPGQFLINAYGQVFRYEG